MRKKVGRPIAYKGDPNAANLTEAERRRIKRRIANRESARRVRARRQETLEELHIRVSHSAFDACIPIRSLCDNDGLCLLIRHACLSASHLIVICRWTRSVCATGTWSSTLLMWKAILCCSKASWKSVSAGGTQHSQKMHACNSKFPLFVPNSRYTYSLFCQPVHWPDGAGAANSNTSAVNLKGLLHNHSDLTSGSSGLNANIVQ